MAKVPCSKLRIFLKEELNNTLGCSNNNDLLVKIIDLYYKYGEVNYYQWRNCHIREDFYKAKSLLWKTTDEIIGELSDKWCLSTDQIQTIVYHKVTAT